MKTKIKVELGDIERTLFMPVWASAVETQKNKPVLIDKTALKIIDSLDIQYMVHLKITKK